MSALTLIEGPPGSGKSDIARSAIQDGEADLLVEFTALWAALRAVDRLPTGRYPIRKNSDPFIKNGYGSALKTTAVRLALQRDLRVIVSSGSRDDAKKWAPLAAEIGAKFEVRTVDPGRAVVTARLADDSGNLSVECQQALGRWYGQ